MSQHPTITLNGAPHPIAAAMTLTQLLETLGLTDKPVVIELNQRAIFPRDYSHIMVEHDAHVEIVTLAAGG